MEITEVPMHAQNSRAHTHTHLDTHRLPSLTPRQGPCPANSQLQEQVTYTQRILRASLDKSYQIWTGGPLRNLVGETSP